MSTAHYVSNILDKLGKVECRLDAITEKLDVLVELLKEEEYSDDDFNEDINENHVSKPRKSVAIIGCQTEPNSKSECTELEQ